MDCEEKSIVEGCLSEGDTGQDAKSKSLDPTKKDLAIDDDEDDDSVWEYYLTSEMVLPQPEPRVEGLEPLVLELTPEVFSPSMQCEGAELRERGQEDNPPPSSNKDPQEKGLSSEENKAGLLDCGKPADFGNRVKEMLQSVDLLSSTKIVESFKEDICVHASSESELTERVVENVVLDSFCRSTNHPLEKEPEGLKASGDVDCLPTKVDKQVSTTDIDKTPDELSTIDEMKTQDKVECEAPLWRKMEETLANVGDPDLKSDCLQAAYDAISATMRQWQDKTLFLPDEYYDDKLFYSSSSFDVDQDNDLSTPAPVERKTTSSFCVEDIAHELRRRTWANSVNRTRATAPPDPSTRQKIPSYFRYTESFRLKQSTPMVVDNNNKRSPWGRANTPPVDLPPVRRTPHLAKKATLNNKNGGDLMVVAKSFSPKTEVKSIRGGKKRDPSEQQEGGVIADKILLTPAEGTPLVGLKTNRRSLQSVARLLK